MEENLKEGYRYYCALCCFPSEDGGYGYFVDFKVIVVSLTGEGALIQVEHMIPLARVINVFPIPVAKVPEAKDCLLNT